MDTSQQENPHFPIDFVPAERRIATLAEDVRTGLLSAPRWLPPKYFYDERGAWLFEGICEQPEYYPTRTETALLAANADAILEIARPAHMLELGSGSSRKTVYLLDAAVRQATPLTYWPFDVTVEMIRHATSDLVQRYPELQFHALIGDYTGGLGGVILPEDGPRLVVLLGGTIGNFEPDLAVQLVTDIRDRLAVGDSLLIGFDRIKDTTRLEAAYDDAAGYTAAFNKNVLNVMNRELDTDFDPDAFSHRALYNADLSRVEMHLVARRGMTVTVGALNEHIEFHEGESINTEISRKFSPKGMHDLLASGGFEIHSRFEDAVGDYSLVLARAI